MMACGSDTLKVEKFNFVKFRGGALKWAHKRTANAGLATGSVCRVVRRSARNVPSLGWAVLYLSIYEDVTESFLMKRVVRMTKVLGGGAQLEL